MAAVGKMRRKILTPYEAKQLEAIARWKSKPPDPFTELWKMIIGPAAKLVEKVIPDAVIRLAIERSYDAGEMLAGSADIQRQSGVNKITELRNQPLEDCDRLAARVGFAARTWATVEGAATGAGGVWTTLLDVPLVFILALRTILKIGHCYGYPLDQHTDRPFVLGVLLAATSGSLEIRRVRLSRLHELEELLLAETQVAVITEEVLSFIFQLEVFEEVPGIGAASGALLNLAFMGHVDITARRVFQERWLLDNGKIHTAVEPAEAAARQLATGWSGALGRAAYSGIYSLSFGAALPIWLVAAALSGLDRAPDRGLEAGRRGGNGRTETSRNGRAQTQATQGRAMGRTTRRRRTTAAMRVR